MGWCPGGDKLDQDIFDAMAEFFAQMLRRAEDLAEQFDVPVFCIKAMHRLDTSGTMKDLGKSMHCDPSFVTMIADALEERELARREPNATDRRIKNLVLTARGLELKQSLEREILGGMPWSQALDVNERKCFLALIRKMISVPAAASAVQTGGDRAGEVSGTSLSTASPGAIRQAKQG